MPAVDPQGLIRLGRPVATSQYDQAPDLFSRVPVDLYAPLSGQYARVYWSILAEFYVFKFEASPAELARDLAVDIADNVLDRSEEWRDRRAELIEALAEEADPEGGRDLVSEFAIRRATARRLIARLQRAGWFYFEFYRDTGEVLNFYPYAARLVGQMLSVARDEQPVLRGYAHAVASLLRPEDFARSPGVAIGAIRDQTIDFARELRILHGNIRESISRLFEEGISAAEVLEETLDRYQDRVRRNYHLLKTRDNIFGWRVEILTRLDAIERQVTHVDEAVRWYAEQRGVSEERAREMVADHLQTIRNHIEAMPRIMAEIDERNQRFSGVAARRVSYLMRHDARTEGMLQALIDRLGAGHVRGLELNVYRAEFLGPGFLYSPRRKKPKVENRRLRERPKIDPDAADEAFLRKVLSKYEEKAITRYVMGMLAGRPRMSVDELPLETDEDYTRAVYITMHGGTKSAKAGYRFRPITCGPRSCSDPACPVCRHIVSPYSIPNGHLERVTGANQ